MSECGKIRESFSDYIDGLLPAGRAAALERHLKGCPECARELEAMKEMIEVMSGMEQVDPPAGFLSRVNSRLDEKESFPERAGRFARRIFLPLRLKLPIELAGVAAALLLVAWISGFPGRDGMRQLSPEGTGVPPATEARRDLPEETEAGPEAKPEDREELHIRGGAGRPAGEKKDKGGGEPLAEKETVPDDGPAAVSVDDAAEAAGSRPKGAQPETDLAEAAVGEKRPPADLSAKADEQVSVAPAAAMVPLQDELSAGEREQAVLPAGEIEKALEQGGLPEEIAALIDSAGGRVLPAAAGEDRWNGEEAEQVYARKASSVRTMSADGGAVDKDGVLRPPVYVMIHRSAVDRFLGILEMKRPEYIITTAAKPAASDSLLIRMDIRRRR